MTHNAASRAHGVVTNDLLQNFYWEKEGSNEIKLVYKPAQDGGLTKYTADTYTQHILGIWGSNCSMQDRDKLLWHYPLLKVDICIDRHGDSMWWLELAVMLVAWDFWKRQGSLIEVHHQLPPSNVSIWWFGVMTKAPTV